MPFRRPPEQLRLAEREASPGVRQKDMGHAQGSSLGTHIPGALPRTPVVALTPLRGACPVKGSHYAVARPVRSFAYPSAPCIDEEARPEPRDRHSQAGAWEREELLSPILGNEG